MKNLGKKFVTSQLSYVSKQNSLFLILQENLTFTKSVIAAFTKINQNKKLTRFAIANITSSFTRHISWFVTITRARFVP